MLHSAALSSSLLALGLTCAIYYCNILSPQKSWLRSEMIEMILLSVLTGVFPLAASATAAAMWQVVSGGLSLQALLSAGFDLGSLAAVVATVMIFVATVRATPRTAVKPNNVTPLKPRPVTPRPSGGKMRKVA
ncbi:hypothetical protein [Maliponia aquimaris]|uniref:Uncharacterized protein n=1 Tax=Maliponia aquimaris TaxID=1673631 RepID=A0A238KJT5_9RHOB|nr:hypothetical protein [Maliponia aquimaris]SMX43099.1 hypothetical protein MAA8898_02739 [Maliponia aquimaris]